MYIRVGRLLYYYIASRCILLLLLYYFIAVWYDCRLRKVEEIKRKTILKKKTRARLQFRRATITTTAIDNLSYSLWYYILRAVDL